MRTKRRLPNGLTVVSELYMDHVIYLVTIGVALFAGAYFLHP